MEPTPESTNVPHSCPDCDEVFPELVNLIFHFRHGPHTSQSCGYCSRSFNTRSAVVQHYESGGCRSKLDRHKLKVAVRLADKDNSVTSTEEQTSEDPPPIATQITKDEVTGLYRCYLCNPAKLGFVTLYDVNQHLASPKHDTKSYKCPYQPCSKPFKTIGGVYQHIETRACGCMAYSDKWHNSPVLPDYVPRIVNGITLESRSGLRNGEELEALRVAKYTEMTGEIGRWEYERQDFTSGVVGATYHYWQMLMKLLVFIGRVVLGCFVAVLVLGCAMVVGVAFLEHN